MLVGRYLDLLDQLNNKLQNDNELRKYIRKQADATGKCWPIKLVDGYKCPTVTGHSFHYVTPGKHRPVYYPNAYRRAWGKPMYVGSTKCIEVGADWILDCIIHRTYFDKEES